MHVPRSFSLPNFPFYFHFESRPRYLPQSARSHTIAAKSRLRLPRDSEADPPDLSPVLSSGPCVTFIPTLLFHLPQPPPLQSRWRPIPPNPPCWSPEPSLLPTRWTGHSGYPPTPKSKAAGDAPAVSSTRNLPNPSSTRAIRLPCPISMLTGSMPRVS